MYKNKYDQNQDQSNNLERCSKIFVSWKKATVYLFGAIGLLIGGVFVYANTVTIMDQKVRTQDTRILKIEDKQQIIEEMHLLINKIAKKLDVDK